MPQYPSIFRVVNFFVAMTALKKIDVCRILIPSSLACVAMLNGQGALAITIESTGSQPIVKNFECTLEGFQTPGVSVGKCTIKAGEIWGFKLSPTEITDFADWISSKLKIVGNWLLSSGTLQPVEGDFTDFSVNSLLLASTINLDGSVTVDPLNPLNTPQSIDDLSFGNSFGFKIPIPVNAQSLSSVLIQGAAQGSSGFIEPVSAGPFPVPAPLPIFGAAAAYGYSRKLRRRIKDSK